MAIGFNTGSKWLDRYYEAYYEVIECYYKNLGKTYGNYGYNYYNVWRQSVLPVAKSLANSTRGQYKSSYYNNYYENLYKNYFNKNSWDSIWSGYGYGGCDVDRILGRWGFSDKKSGSGGGSGKKKSKKNEYDTITPPKKYGKSYADKITNFDSSSDNLKIDKDLFGVGKKASFKAAKNKKYLGRYAKKGYDFIYDEKKGYLYFNENGSDKGFGDGGIIAILKGAPDLNSSDLKFI